VVLDPAAITHALRPPTPLFPTFPVSLQKEQPRPGRRHGARAVAGEADRAEGAEPGVRPPLPPRAYSHPRTSLHPNTHAAVPSAGAGPGPTVQIDSNGCVAMKQVADCGRRFQMVVAYGLKPINCFIWLAVGSVFTCLKQFQKVLELLVTTGLVSTGRVACQGSRCAGAGAGRRRGARGEGYGSLAHTNTRTNTHSPTPPCTPPVSPQIQFHRPGRRRGARAVAGEADRAGDAGPLVRPPHPPSREKRDASGKGPKRRGFAWVSAGKWGKREGRRRKRTVSDGI
jgi:hypothetical protein